jgi:hypothetical protein
VPDWTAGHIRDWLQTTAAGAAARTKNSYAHGGALTTSSKPTDPRRNTE